MPRLPFGPMRGHGWLTGRRVIGTGGASSNSFGSTSSLECDKLVFVVIVTY